MDPNISRYWIATVGFWQVEIKEEHKELTGFSVPSGHYEFKRPPFGL
jgi:hypothetical protein